MPKLTVFTPTYNRANLLQRAFEALCRQTSKDFVWFIIDDGSTDNTRELADSWIKTADFEIRYVYKENGGLYTGYNKAIELADTELMVCIDSDDYMPDDAVERIVSFWERNGSPEYAGIIGLDYTPQGEVIGDPLPEQKSINTNDLLMGKYKLNDLDRKYVVRTELYKPYTPLTGYEGEKDFNPHYLHVLISREYDFLVCNENFCFVDYQPDGMTKAIFKQYVRSPKSFAKTRILYLSLKGAPLEFKLRHNIHYVSSSILSRNKNFIKESPTKILTVLMIPFGLLLTLFVKLKAGKSL